MTETPAHTDPGYTEFMAMEEGRVLSIIWAAALALSDRFGRSRARSWVENLIARLPDGKAA